jgi:RNA-directed DNA polymerase
VLQGTIAGQEGKPQPVSLLKASSVPIKRHTKIQGEANPYDPAWEKDFERRSDVKMEATLQGRRPLLTL